MIETVEACADVEDIACYDHRLAVADGIRHLFREERESACQRSLCLAGRIAGSFRFIRNTGGFFNNAAAPRIGVLRIGAGVSLERKCLVKIEVAVLYAAVREVVEHNRADSDSLRNLVLVFKGGILLLDYLSDLFDSHCEEILQQNNVSAPRRELFAVDADRTVGDVYKLVVPVVAHKLDNLEPLTEVQYLLI